MIANQVPSLVAITTTGSLPVVVVGTVPISAGTTLNVAQQGQISVNNFPATQAISGSVTPIVGPSGFWFAGTSGISGTVQIWSEGALPVSNSVGAPLFVSEVLPTSASTFGTNQANYYNVASVTTNQSSGAIPVGNAALFDIQWVCFTGISQNFTGSIGVQKSNDLLNWIDVYRVTTLLQNPLVTTVSGTFSTSAFGAFYRLNIAVNTVSSAGMALSSSYAVKG